MDKIKCITFDKAAQDALPEHIKAKMKADREKARLEAYQKQCPCWNSENNNHYHKATVEELIEHFKEKEVNHG
jgi:hypothetical protein